MNLTVDQSWGVGQWTNHGEWNCGPIMGSGTVDQSWGVELWTNHREWDTGPILGSGTGPIIVNLTADQS